MTNRDNTKYSYETDCDGLWMIFDPDGNLEAIVSTRSEAEIYIEHQEISK